MTEEGKEEVWLGQDEGSWCSCVELIENLQSGDTDSETIKLIACCPGHWTLEDYS